jgi:Fic family protein
MALHDDKRAYLKSHPWLTFQFDGRLIDYQTWMLLGEAKSKCQHIVGSPLLPDVQHVFYQVYLSKGALGTTAIEGNTLTIDEVNRRIEGKLTLPPSKEYLGKEIDNVVKAYNEIGAEVIRSGGAKITLTAIKQFNQFVLDGLPLDESVVPGAIRSYLVRVGAYQGAPPEDIEYLLERYVHWLNDQFDFPPADKVAFGIIKAILAHLYFAWIHPFGDGNGRTARLIEFQILLSAGIPALSAHLMSNHYNVTRNEYYRLLDLASKTGGDPLPFIHYALQGFVDGLKEQIDLIQGQQLRVHWVYYVHTTFSDQKLDREDDKRRKTLVLAMSDKPALIPIDEIRHISPEVAEMYARLSEKTMLRDITKLIELRLLKKEGKAIRLNLESIQQLMPPRVLGEINTGAN